MTITLLFMAFLMGVVVWWLVKQTINIKPWVMDDGVLVGDVDAGVLSEPKAKTGLWVFLAVVTSMFCLFISAYAMRMKLGDWTPLPEPDLLWVNTGLLVLSSIALQWARNAAKQDRIDSLKVGLNVAGVLTIGFIVGQLFAWRQLVDDGYFLNSNPANAFFYLFTALHGLHILGGLVAWIRAVSRLWRGSDAAQVRLSVELCAVYWHFLLIVWLILFGLMLST
ncbi:MAG: cytochrome-c oxidase [Proteobacteria bacterium]|nr:cytochrome-c oxidase [Pseudomonadota bacterium]